MSDVLGPLPPMPPPKQTPTARPAPEPPGLVFPGWVILFSVIVVVAFACGLIRMPMVIAKAVDAERAQRGSPGVSPWDDMSQPSAPPRFPSVQDPGFPHAEAGGPSRIGQSADEMQRRFDEESKTHREQMDRLRAEARARMDRMHAETQAKMEQMRRGAHP